MVLGSPFLYKVLIVTQIREPIWLSGSMARTLAALRLCGSALTAGGCLEDQPLVGSRHETHVLGTKPNVPIFLELILTSQYDLISCLRFMQGRTGEVLEKELAGLD